MLMRETEFQDHVTSMLHQSLRTKVEAVGEMDHLPGSPIKNPSPVEN
ncbi:hypothetical protein [Thermoflavimicrobium dichotomicum]|uniref:Uncharacterized protein n=1 Tax=Thermoflavimicrobium dichotomicum TaxID=46223 RepID=A0A1I3UQV4_9BACL|nr:hypothetical protein [Thermoflavimicrobium dichotomicum]SFJ85342.1 hypothetical protein SAMN05421852_1277 [Thermoflavimicrobium dichotomicum]